MRDASKICISFCHLGLCHYLILRKWRSEGLEREPFFPPCHHTDCISFLLKPVYHDESFLQQKYVAEGLSIAQIASETFSSKTAIRAALNKFNIPIREAHQNHGNPSQLRFGQRRVKNSIKTHALEKLAIDSILEMKTQNLSLRQIASILTKMKIKTKNRGKWHPEMIKRIIESRAAILQ